jgi:hypothetical protein
LQYFNSKYYFLIACIFLIALSSNAQQCVNGQTFTISPSGPYQPGDVVEVTYNMNYFEQINNNWLIAFQVNLGDGWENLTPLTNPINSGQPGNWVWDNQNTFPSGLNFGPGWRFITNVYNPNYGINSNGPFSMSFEVTVSETCSPDDLLISLEPIGDCLTGGWNAGNCCNDPAFVVYNGVVDVNNSFPSAGSSNSITICPWSDPINLFNELGDSPEINGTWNPSLLNGYLGNFDPSTNPSNDYTYSITNECGLSSATINVNFIEPIISNTNMVEICSDAVSIDLYGEIGINNTSGQWSGVGPLFENPSPDYLGLFNPQEQIPGIYNYTIINANGCETVYPVDVQVLSSQANAGNGVEIQLCQDDQNILLFNQLTGNPDQNGVWSPNLPNGFQGEFNPSYNNEGTYTYSVSDLCGTESSNVQISFYEINTPNTTFVEICSDAVSIDLYGEIGIFNTSGQWSGVGPLLESPAPDYFGLFNPQEQLEGLYNYTINDVNGCDQSYPVDVSLLTSNANAGLDGSLDLCQDDSSVNLFDYISGDPDQNGSWSPFLTGDYLGVFDPSNNFSGNYTYTVEDECGSDNSEVLINITIVNPPPIILD